ncbi:MAG: hypothetical protein FJ266_10945 [Planctomycetes bacterium]|nr:hypothetical protein [Planctomycetota bacterium]
MQSRDTSVINPKDLNSFADLSRPPDMACLTAVPFAWVVDADRAVKVYDSFPLRGVNGMEIATSSGSHAVFQGKHMAHRVTH